jgi:hypothetical protein
MGHETGADNEPIFFTTNGSDCISTALAQPMCFHIFLHKVLLAILSSTTNSYARYMQIGRPNEQAVLKADEFLALIERHLSELWQAHASSGNRSLRVVLHSAEALPAGVGRDEPGNVSQLATRSPS